MRNDRTDPGNNTDIDGQRDAALTGIVDSVIRPIVRRKLHVSLQQADMGPRNQDALELVNDVHLRLLSELRSRRGRGSIQDLDAYSATVTQNVCYQYLRARFPVRMRLRNKLRYLLTHETGLALWRGPDGSFLCGPEKSSGQAMHTALPEMVGLETLSWSGRREMVETLTAFFARCDGPVLFEELIERIVVVSGLSEPFEFEGDDGESYESAMDPHSSLVAELESHEGAKLLWERVLELPVEHRKALLLNLREPGGENALVALPLAGIAGLRDIAAALEMPVEDLAAIWNSLPWDDHRIGEHLGRTRQQVINLRQSARIMLTRWRVSTGNI